MKANITAYQVVATYSRPPSFTIALGMMIDGKKRHDAASADSFIVALCKVVERVTLKSIGKPTEYGTEVLKGKVFVRTTRDLGSATASDMTNPGALNYDYLEAVLAIASKEGIDDGV